MDTQRRSGDGANVRDMHNLHAVHGPGDGAVARAFAPQSLALPVVLVTVPVALAFIWPALPIPALPPGAGIVLAAITLGMAYGVRWLRRRFDLGDDVALPDPLITLYLAVVVLAGMRAALLLAAAVPWLTLIADRRRPGAVARALREAAEAVLITAVAGLTYWGVSALLDPSLRVLHAHLIAALAASVVILVCLVFARVAGGEAGSRTTWMAYAASPAMRFQVLMLAIGPLFPLAERLDDVETEVAWLLFLVPLLAMYYLALLSVRFEQRTEQLQRTIAELGRSRRREAELTDYAALVTRAQEDERRRLARELHDDTAQTLVALTRGLDALAVGSRGHAEEDARFVEELGLLAKRSLESIRRACQDLRPSVLDDLGLAAALDSLAHSMTQRGLRCTFERTGEAIPCPPEIEVTVYRIAQESLSNALRHAGACTTTIRLDYDADALRLTATDDGEGFDPAAYLQRGRSPVAASEGDGRPSLGLLGMRERAALIGATLDIASAPGAGVRVALTVPLHPAQRDERDMLAPSDDDEPAGDTFAPSVETSLSGGTAAR